jgi:hypothetical protein
VRLMRLLSVSLEFVADFDTGLRDTLAAFLLMRCSFGGT